MGELLFSEKTPVRNPGQPLCYWPFKVCTACFLHLFFCYMQVTFQVVLSTDGRASFATLVYEDPINVMSGRYQVGFDSGDRRRGVNLLGADSISWNTQRVNIFRIDGKSVILENDCCSIAITLLKYPS